MLIIYSSVDYAAAFCAQLLPEEQFLEADKAGAEEALEVAPQWHWLL